MNWTCAESENIRADIFALTIQSAVKKNDNFQKETTDIQ